MLVPVRLKVWAPLIVLENVIAAPVVETVLTVKLLVKVTGPATEAKSSVVWMLPPIKTAPVPVCWKGPSREKAAPAAVKVPELFKTSAPPFEVVIDPDKLTALVAILIPPAPVVESPPAKVVVPRPPVCVKAPKFTELLNETFSAVVTAIDVKGAEFPTSPTKESEFAAPGLKITLRVLRAESALRVLLNVIAPVKMRLFAAIITGEPNTRGPVWFVVIVIMVGELNTGVVLEWITPVTLITDAVTVTLCTLPERPMFVIFAVPVFAFRMMFWPGPLRSVRVMFPLLVFTVKSVPALNEMVPLTKVIAPPPEVRVVKAPDVKLKLVPAV